MSRSDSKPIPVQAYALYFGVIVLMLTLGLWLQSLHLQGGLIASEAFCIFLPALAVRWLRRDDVEFPSFQRLGMRWPWLFWVAATAALVGIGANILTGLIVELVPSLQESAKAYEEMVEQLLWPDDPLLLVLGIVAVTVAAPLGEEFLFRGVILPMQRAGEMRVEAVLVINGLLFALLHFNPMGFLALAAVGIFFAHLVVLTDSLWPSIVAHATLNTVNGVVVPWALRQSETDVVEPELSELLIAAAIILPLVAISWRWGASRLRSQS
jgi:membrane protease YdiL (CAAX protease family)